MFLPLLRGVRRLTLAFAAFILADVVIGCTVFSISTLAILTGFGAGWVTLASEYSAHALVFGTSEQLRSAVGLLVVCPPFAVLVGWIGVRSFQLPRRLWRLARGNVGPSEGPETPIPFGVPFIPMSEGALWAARARRAPSESPYVSLLIPGH